MTEVSFSEVMRYFGSRFNFAKFPKRNVCIDVGDSQLHLRDAIVFGDDECWHLCRFFQYAFANGRVYMLYYHYDNEIPLDDIDYSKAEDYDDITEDITKWERYRVI